MNLLKSAACAGIVGAGFLMGAPQEADAGGGFSISIGRGYYGGAYGLGNYGLYGGYSGYGHGHYGHRHGGAVWHDTSHYDFHPGGYYPHGNHFHYVPPHSHFHPQGHWDHYGRW